MPTMLKSADRKALLALIESVEKHLDAIPHVDDLRDQGGVDEAREKVDGKSEKWAENEDNANKVEGLEQIEAELERYETAYDDFVGAVSTLKELLT